ncbi:MAG TPA: alkaline phosphatase family protein [Tepidisphaeraceae bacterium]|nr:alkaline phosphatase family protein [Tepidisphaeraceae bacterium]
MSRRMIIPALWSACGAIGAPGSALAAAPLPYRYDHVVIVIEENKGYPTIIGSSSAPYINQLATEGANFTNFYAFPHTSAPNYGELFAGYHNNIPDFGIAPGVPLTTPNLGAEIRAAGFSFGGYAQGLPSVGFTGESSGDYVRRHNPWVNWQNDAPDAHPNQLPSSVNMPFSMFPANFANLPTVSFVIPDNLHNMHDAGAGPISTADTWLKNNIDAYYQWAKTHNSLLIVTYDEDGHETNNYNRIPTLFAGAGVRPGSTISSSYTLHNFLRTVEDMYGTTHAVAAARVKPISGALITDPPGVTKTFREGVNSYTGAHDTHLRQDQPTTTFGATTMLIADSDNNGAAGDQPTQALVRFDNIIGSTAGQIPAGATIASAKLILFSDPAAGGETINNIEIHRMLTSWGEGSTWNSLGGGVSADGIESAAAPDFNNAPLTLNHPWFFDVTDTVQSWANGATNFGWAVLPTGADDYRFNSSEAATANLRPGLEITYLLMSQWSAAGGSSWGNSANWAGGVPNAVGTIVTLANSTTSANSTLTLDGSRTIGKLIFDHTNTYIIAPGAGGTLTINNGGLAPAEINVIRGNHSILAALNIADHTTVDIAAGSTLNATGAMTVDPGKKVTKQNSGTLAAGNISLASGATLAVSAGSVSANSITGAGALEIHASSRLTLNAGAGASKVSALNFDGSTNNWQGQLDLKNNSLIIQAASANRLAVLDTILNQIRTARNSTSTRWAGQGIASSTAASDSTRISGIGAILNDNGSGGVLYSSFFGQPVDINSILIRYTFNGDLDLDGGIDADDYARIDAGFAQKLTGWRNGDLNYSGSINADDFFLIDQAFSGQTAGMPPPAFGPMNVPEPSFAALMAALGLLGLRRRGSPRGPSSSRCSIGTTRRISSMLV